MAQQVAATLAQLAAGCANPATRAQSWWFASKTVSPLFLWSAWTSNVLAFGVFKVCDRCSFMEGKLLVW